MRRGFRVPGAPAVVVALGLLAGCASTPEEQPAEVVDARLPDVSATQLAHDLGLVPTVTESQAVLESRNGGRILVFTGTRLVTVAGTKVELTAEAWAAGADVWLTADDAATIRATWGIVVANGGDLGASTAELPEGPELPLPPAPSPRAAPLPTRPVTGANLPTAREIAAWAVPRRRPWRYLVIHHSASPAGSAAAFDRAHRAKGWDGLGYHFVIGNGTGSGDGEVEVGYRWKQQLVGAHAKTPDNLYNETGIGICLVGDFSASRPTAAQMRSLSRLCAFLGSRYGIPPSQLRRHGDLKSTECPGRYFPRNFTYGMTALGGVLPAWNVADAAPR